MSGWNRFRWVLALAVLAAPMQVANAAEPRELSAWDLWAQTAISQVSVSPSGEWIAAVAQHGDDRGILVQRRGDGITVPVYISDTAILGTVWVGEDTLFVEHSNRERLKAVAIRFRAGDYTILFDVLKIDRLGYLVHPLADQDDIVLWADFLDGHWVVRRGPVSALVRGKGWKATGRWAEGEFETVAKQRRQVGKWLADRNGVIRAALVFEGGRTPKAALRYRKGENGAWRTVWKGGTEEDLIRPMGITTDDQRLIVAASGEHDTVGLHELDPASGKLVREIYRRPNVDITGASFDYGGVELIAAEYRDAGTVAYHYFEDFQAKHLPQIDELGLADSVAITGSSRDHRFFTLFAFDAQHPGSYYFFAKETKKVSHMGDINPRVKPELLVPMRSLEVVSKDGTRVEAYLATPGRFDGELPPLLVYPHGGPIGVQDDRSFDPMVQFFALAGIAVMKVNYRGSEGYGKSFLEAGARQWGRGIEEDIDAAVQRVIDEGLVDPERMCIAGGSYGGYSALASAIRWPERYRCVVTINGVTDLPLMISNSWRSPGKRKFFREFVGDLESDFDSIMEISPAYHVEKLRVPVMIVLGGEDARVDPDHANRLRAMMEAHGKPVEWLEIPDMGHSPSSNDWGVIARRMKWFVTCHIGQRSPAKSHRWRERSCAPESLQ